MWFQSLIGYKVMVISTLLLWKKRVTCTPLVKITVHAISSIDHLLVRHTVDKTTIKFSYCTKCHVAYTLVKHYNNSQIKHENV